MTQAENRQPYDLTNDKDREELISIIRELKVGTSLVALIVDNNFTQGDIGKVRYYTNIALYDKGEGVALDFADTDDGLALYATCIALQPETKDK